MSAGVRLTLLKQTEGSWEQVKGYVHDDLERIEIDFNRLTQLVAVPADIPAQSSVTITDMLPAVMLLAAPKPQASSSSSVDPIPTAFLFGGGM